MKMKNKFSGSRYQNKTKEAIILLTQTTKIITIKDLLVK